MLCEDFEDSAYPPERLHFVKTKLGVEMPPLEIRRNEELEFREEQVKKYIKDFLANHDFVTEMKMLNIATMSITLRDDRTLQVFLTHTYIFTEYTLNKVLAINPQIEVIICSCPHGGYDEAAKQLCIEYGIGLFMISEFMGAVRKTGEEFLNYLLKADRESRIKSFQRALHDVRLPRGLRVYLFGSFLRRKIYRDIDALVVYSGDQAKEAVEKLEQMLKATAARHSSRLHLTVCSEQEFSAFQRKLTHDDLTEVYTS